MPKTIIDEFEKQYGKGGKKVYYATANKQNRDPETFKKKSNVELLRISEHDGFLESVNQSDEIEAENPGNALDGAKSSSDMLAYVRQVSAFNQAPIGGKIMEFIAGPDGQKESSRLLQEQLDPGNSEILAGMLASLPSNLTG